MIKRQKHQRGFTLIELLVVVSIIGLLSSVVLVATNNAVKKSRDARRIADIEQLQKALDLYYIQYNRYPLSGQCGATIPNSGWTNSVECLSGGRWLRDATSNLSAFLGKDPIDPTNQSPPVFASGEDYFYFSQGYGGTGQWYMIIYRLEIPNPVLEGQDGVTAPNGTYFHYGNGTNGIMTVGKKADI